MSKLVLPPKTPRETIPILEEVAARRVFQNERWGGADHDDQHSAPGEMAAASAAYAWFASLRDHERSQVRHRLSAINETWRRLWPKSWAMRGWSPKTRRDDLIDSAALAIAEIERIDRAAERAAKPSLLSAG